MFEKRPAERCSGGLFCVWQFETPEGGRLAPTKQKDFADVLTCASLDIMKKQISPRAQTSAIQLAGSKLTSERAEKISAVEGMRLTTRMDAVLRDTKGQPGDERRAAIRAQFSKTSRSP